MAEADSFQFTASKLAHLKYNSDSYTERRLVFFPKQSSAAHRRSVRFSFYIQQRISFPQVIIVKEL